MVENVRHRLRKNACTSMSFPVGGRGRVSTRPDRVTVCPLLRAPRPGPDAARRGHVQREVLRGGADPPRARVAKPDDLVARAADDVGEPPPGVGARDPRGKESDRVTGRVARDLERGAVDRLAVGVLQAAAELELGSRVDHCPWPKGDPPVPAPATHSRGPPRPGGSRTAPGGRWWPGSRSPGGRWSSRCRRGRGRRRETRMRRSGTARRRRSPPAGCPDGPRPACARSRPRACASRWLPVSRPDRASVASTETLSGSAASCGSNARSGASWSRRRCTGSEAESA